MGLLVVTLAGARVSALTHGERPHTLFALPLSLAG
jgi:hypothetical protein